MEIKQPRWKVPEYTRREINDAGNILRNHSGTDEDKEKALAVIDNWRSAHAYPMHVFYMNLRGKANGRSDILVAERLKRMSSIIDKLQRENTMELYRMQDLGGCRMVLPTLDELYKISEAFQKSDIRHRPKMPKDYIKNPKASGYRSLHLIYRFQTDTFEKRIYNEYPMLIELQFRTHLQHIWATAVETMGLFTNQALKAGRGSRATLRFFALISSLFAIREGCPTVPGTPCGEEELIEEISELNHKYHILDSLRATVMAIEQDTTSIRDRRGYYLLLLDYNKATLQRWFFRPSELEEANAQYDSFEKVFTQSSQDLVLVRADSYQAVKKAYPNYFLDISEFISLVVEYLR